MVIWGILSIVVIVIAVVFVFINQPSFGRTPRGERLERIKRSSHYYNGKFQNEHETPVLTTDKSRISNFLDFIFRKKEGLRPETKIPVIKTDLDKINLNEDLLVWFGHSSYLIQIDGKRFLIDPVFRMASPVSFFNKPFEGTDVYSPNDIPYIDYLIITHDHWDHLDYQTIMELKKRIGKVICGLGVGEHFEYWGFDKNQLIELDWNEDANLETGFIIHCLPARHFSGRGLISNQSLWASFLLESPSMKIYMAGDGGYDTHYTEIGKRFPDMDLAILENGQYNKDWRYIHLMPQEMAQTVEDLRTKKVLTVHHSKYALAEHRWDEPMKNAQNMALKDSLNVLIPQIGEIIYLKQ